MFYRYWVSKKQYYCKYCSIYIRDDAPSRKQHETGLKHIGNVERYIRDLYKTGSMAKKEKAENEAEMARIEASAAAAYANDKASGAVGSSSTSKPSILQSLPSSSTSAEASIAAAKAKNKPTDKYSNYSTAESLGYKEVKSQYEIDQEIKNSVGQPSSWETIEVLQYTISNAHEDEGEGGKESLAKRKFREETEEDENESFKFEYNKTKKIKDIYDDDWDPKSALKGLKIKKKEEKLIINPKDIKEEENNRGLDRNQWTGKLELNAPSSASTSSKTKDGLEYLQGGGWIKKDAEDDDNGIAADQGRVNEVDKDTKPDIAITNSETVQPVTVEAEPQSIPEPAAAVGGGSMFKKRRPPPSSRKK
ncbi:uncharacterized protein L201_003317 [Kwoniella dendrophila CBS 6074]|uniref:Matrin-type domain-containing protein n=1 Tax=Kwoniella dendrophila CBS 6074 TaxID=1295534 RepID=A0AAX4JSL4_9TREE